MTDSPIIDPVREALGAERLEKFAMGHGNLQAMALFLTMSVLTVPRTGYSPEAIQAMKLDADDVRKAADEWASACEALADEWQQQREQAESALIDAVRTDAGQS